MYKKISGVKDSGDLESVKAAVRQARADFQDAVQHNYAKRSEYLQMKADNNLEREILKKEERMAKSFKFTKMSKRVPFLPSLHQKGFLQDDVKGLDNETKFRDDREIQALIYPTKATEKGIKFNLVRTQNVGYISKPIGQEFDTYDPLLQKFYNSKERGTLKPIKTATGETIKQDPTITHIGSSKGVWQSNSFTPALLAPHKPMLARELTPRG